MFNNEIFDSWLNKKSDEILSKVDRERISTEEMIILVLKAQTNHFHHMDVDMKKGLSDIDHKFTTKFEEVETKFEQVDKRFEQVDKRFEQVDKRFEQVDKRFEQVDKRFEQVDKRFEQVDRRFEQIDSRLEKLDQKIDNRF